MLVCRDCGFDNLGGALYCTECGGSLLELGGAPAVSDELLLVRQPALVGQITNQLENKDEIIIMIPSSGRFLRFPLNSQISVGRAETGDGPVLNLESDGGKAWGVSRKHAVIQRDDTNDHLLLTDLNSTNGTVLNGYLLPSELPYPLKSGDEIQFGNLLIHIFLK